MTNREDAFLNILKASVKMQRNISKILEAKAVESEKVRDWTLNHLHAANFMTDEDQMKETHHVHSQIVEIIEAVTKMETGLCSNLKVVLTQEGEVNASGGGFGNMLGGGDMGDYDK